MLNRVLAVALLFLCAMASVAFAAGKVALVIGNGAYQNANVLPNPANDATAMTSLLQQLGFEVISGTDLDFAGMGEKIGAFEDAARNADVTLLFYAGHGMQVNGRNFLVPVNAKLERESSLQFETIDSDTVLRSMSGPGKTAIVLLDACRDNPLSRRFARSLGATRSNAVAQGLAVPQVAGGGILIGFATAPGDVAADGDGQNSPFTTALLKHLAEPGVEIQQVMTRVKRDVFELTKESQEPWHNSSLRSEIYLGGDIAAQPKTEAPQKQNAPTSNIEAEWNLVKESNSVAVLNAFIAAHADKPLYVALAEERKKTVQLNNIVKVTKLKPLSEILPDEQQPQTQGQSNSDTALLDSLKIPEAPGAEPSATDQIKKQAFENTNKKLKAGNDGEPLPRSSGYTIDSFFDFAGSANKGSTQYALFGAPTVELTAPVKNAGSKTPAFRLSELAKAPALEVLLQSGYSLSDEASTNCRLDWLDRCPFLPQPLVTGLGAAMAAKGMNIAEHSENYFQISRIAGSEYYMLSNSPAFGKGNAVIVAAIVSSSLDVIQLYSFDLSKKTLGTEAVDAASSVLVTWAAMEGDDLIVSFDSSYRCTDGPRRFGFITRFTMQDRSVKWTSPFSVSDVNFIISGDSIISANGGSCVDDYVYGLDKHTGKVLGRFKTPTAVERMDASGGPLVLQLYEGAAAYQLP